MLAYHSDPKIKAKYLRRVRAHAKADQIIKGTDGLILAALQDGAWSVDTMAGTVRSRRFADRRAVGVLNASGYMVATLHYGGRRAQVKLHRVIWMAQHGPIADDLVPDHIDRNRSNNAISNLRLVDAKGNAANRRSYAGEGNPAAKITVAIAKEIRSSPSSYAVLAKRFGVSKSLVASISRGELWT